MPRVPVIIVLALVLSAYGASPPDPKIAVGVGEQDAARSGTPRGGPRA